jgi:hypothetical protein
MPGRPTPPAWLRFLSYAGCVTFACGFLAYGLRLDRADLAAPLADEGDALLILPMVLAQHEGGTHWVNARMGAPGRQELYDFPVIDHWHFAAIALLDRVIGNPIVAFNLYYLLTYPLAAFCAMFAARCIGLSLPAAGCLGLLYAFLPYHAMRGLSHYFLSAYYLVPLALVPVVNLALGRLRRGLWPVLVMAVTSCAGAYYAFFTCVLLVSAALYGADLRRSARPLAWGALLIAVVFVGGVANHAPTFLHQREFGHNTAPAQRMPEDTEVYALRLTYLLMPIPDHRIPALARWRSGHDSVGRPHQADANAAMLGVVGVAGLVLAAVALFRPRPGRRVTRAVAGLVGWAFVVATAGGLGAVYSDLVSPAARGLARISVFVGFLAFWLALTRLDRWTRRSRLRWPLFTLVAAVGLADTTSRDWGSRTRVAEEERVRLRQSEDAAFYRAVEVRVGDGMVFQLPFNDYPEGTRLPLVGGYDHARGMVYTTRTRWSFGAMRGREADQWQREVSAAAVPEMLQRVTLRGFDGLVIDTQAVGPDGPTFQAALNSVLGVPGPDVIHPSGRLAFYDLRPYCDRLRRELGGDYDTRARAEAEAVRVLWFRCFDSFEPLGKEDTHRWCASRGEAWVVNPSDRTRRVTLSYIARTVSPFPTTLRITGDTWAETFDIDSSSGVRTVTLDVPPGRHRVDFACDPPRGWVPHDARRHVFFLAQFRLSEGP